MKRTLTSIFAIMLALVMVLSLAACGGGSNSSKGEEEKTEMSLDEMLKISQTTNINTMMKEALDNIARAENTYVGNTYTVWGKIVKISKDSIYLRGNMLCSINVCAYLPSDEIMNFNEGDAIQIVGTVEEITEENEDRVEAIVKVNTYVMKNAHFVNDIYEIKNADIHNIIYSRSTGKYDCEINDEIFGRIRINTGKITNLQWQHEDSYSVSASGKMTTEEDMLTMDDSNFVIKKK